MLTELPYAGGYTSTSRDMTVYAFDGQRKLLAGDGPRWVDYAYVQNIRTGKIVRLSRGKVSTEFPSLSADGTRVAYLRYPDGYYPAEVYVTDLRTGRSMRVSTPPTGDRFECRRPAISPDGTAVAFYACGRTVVPGDTNHRDDVYVRRLPRSW